MLEWIMIAAATIAMARFGETDRDQGFLWGGITFVLCLVSLLLPLPLLRIGLVCIIVFVLMTVTKKTYY